VADLGLLKNYPTGTPDSFRYMSRKLEDGTWIAPKLACAWFPDAFIGTMASVMRGLEGSPGAPETSVSDNLQTLRLVLAAYQSMSSGQSVDPSTV
jgi:predicted dehydrogenase